MKKSEAIKKVEAYLKIQNEGEMDMVPIVVEKTTGWMFHTGTSINEVIEEIRSGEKINLDILKDCEILLNSW